MVSIKGGALMRKDFYILFILLLLTLVGCSKQEYSDEALASETLKKDTYIQELENSLRDHEEAISDLTNTVNTYKEQAADKETKLLSLINQENTLREELAALTIVNKDLLSKTSVPKNKKNYSIYSKHKRLDETDVIMSYPQIYSHEIDYNKVSNINDIIFTDLKNFINPYRDYLETVTLDLFFEVKLTNHKLLSITYWGLADDESFIHPHKLKHTTTINIAAGSVLTLKDMVDISPDFIDFFMDKNFQYIGPLLLDDSDIDSIYDQYRDLDYLLMTFRNADTTESSISSYLTEKGLVIVTDANHAIGGYAEFLIDYKDIENYITLDLLCH